MYEFTIINNITNEEDIIFGYSVADAFRRAKRLDPSEWTVIRGEYID